MSTSYFDGTASVADTQRFDGADGTEGSRRTSLAPREGGEYPLDIEEEAAVLRAQLAVNKRALRAANEHGVATTANLAAAKSTIVSLSDAKLAAEAALNAATARADKLNTALTACTTRETEARSALAAAHKEITALRRVGVAGAAGSGALEARLSRALGEVESLKEKLAGERGRASEASSSLRSKVAEGVARERALEKQVADAVGAYRRAMELVAALRAKLGHAEAGAAVRDAEGELAALMGGAWVG